VVNVDLITFFQPWDKTQTQIFFSTGENRSGGHYLVVKHDLETVASIIGDTAAKPGKAGAQRASG